jgi:HSP20 family protein
MARDNPFEKVEEMLRRMDQELDADPLGMATSPVSVDVRDRGDAFVVTADLPGFEKEDVEVTLADRTLRIEADHEAHAETGEGEYIRRERRHESASRSVRLPEAVAEDGIEATYSNGVLTVTLPKQDAEGGTQIDIE